MSKAVLFFADGTEECEALLVADLLRRFQLPKPRGAKIQATLVAIAARTELS